MSNAARYANNSNAVPRRASRDEPDYERFCTDWYMPDSASTAAGSEPATRKPAPSARSAYRGASAGRFARAHDAHPDTPLGVTRTVGTSEVETP